MTANLSLWGRVKAAFSRPRVTTATGAVVGQLPLWQQFNRIGGGLTPADVSSILYSADTGDMGRLVELANESRQKDGHLHSVLRARETALSTLPLTFSPFKARDDAEPSERDAEVAAFVEDVLLGASGDGEDLRGLDDLTAHLQGGIYHGYAHAETAWRREGRRLIVDGWALIDQRRFRYRWADGRLVFTDYLASAVGAGSGIDLMREYPGQYVQHQPRENGDVAAREGLSRLLVWCALFRNWSMADWMKLAEMSWKPWRLGKLTPNSGDDDRDDLIEILDKLTTDGYGILGPNQEIEFPTPMAGGRSSGSGNHQSLCEFMGAEMSKAVLGQTLTTESGSRGARSLGEVHDGIRKELRDYDAKRVAATLKRDVVRPLVWLNYGPATPLPNVGYATSEAVDLQSFGKGVAALKLAGLRIPASWVYDVAGVPEPGEDDEILGATDVDLTDLEDDSSDAEDEDTNGTPDDTEPSEGEDEGSADDAAEE